MGEAFSEGDRVFSAKRGHGTVSHVVRELVTGAPTKTIMVLFDNEAGSGARVCGVEQLQPSDAQDSTEVTP